jgi:predicted transcriptional regulator
MSEVAKSKKEQDTQSSKIDLLTDTADAFVNALYKKLRNKNKKLKKIEQTEKQVKNKEIVLNEDLKGML